MQDKIIELETKFSFQEDLLQELNKELLVQQRQINELLREMASVKEQLADIVDHDSEPAAAANEFEKPPHY